ncbi:MAG TPA: hypothetical protein DCY88_30580 [Cyanobacteria bacterium UBA11372]|nr:hypothetical protein [Cyanobacteria bacterium UBA11372]
MTNETQVLFPSFHQTYGKKPDFYRDQPRNPVYRQNSGFESKEQPRNPVSGQNSGFGSKEQPRNPVSRCTGFVAKLSASKR